MSLLASRPSGMWQPSRTLPKVPSGTDLRELSAEQFSARLDTYIGIYAAAMNAPPLQLPGRRSIMARHTMYPSFRAIVATPAPPAAAGGQGTGPAGESRAAGVPGTGVAPGPDGVLPPVVGFAYGFHGERGQWWHDLVRSALTASHSTAEAQRWMSDSFEIAEVHVDPGCQGHGIGRAMMLKLAAGRLEQTAVLSTPDADTRARRLYHRLGFADLLTAFSFPGGGPPYAVMGTALPLRVSASPSR
jgi:GNAT superfamily N-acetyltransferase